MPYSLRREVRDGQLVRLSLGLGLADDCLDFLRCRARPNTWLNYAHDLKVFFCVVDKPVEAVTTADVFRFMQQQVHPLATDPAGQPPPTVCARTLKRRLCAVSNLYTYLITRGDTPITRNPVPTGQLLRGHALATPRRSTPLLRTPQTLPELVPVAQVQRFLASLATHRDKAMVLLMALGGLRKSEVLGLTAISLMEHRVPWRELGELNDRGSGRSELASGQPPSGASPESLSADWPGRQTRSGPPSGPSLTRARQQQPRRSRLVSRASSRCCAGY